MELLTALSSIFSAFGLSASAGLNAYLPLLIVALAARFTPLINLASPYDVLASWWAIGTLTVLLLIEFFADKIPAVNHVNDVIQTIVRPAAGAILFAASTTVITKMHPAVAIVLGLIVAGSVHAVKAAAVRPAVTATTGGMANPIVSLVEDVIATILSILAVVVPIVIGAVIALATAWLILWLWRRSAREARTS
ncbi:MAG: DUF4126 domain-containing protein [Chloroflexi bacterium]|nr:DUF4126 domain-containing protein [Chloroflexota bacterium]